MSSDLPPTDGLDPQIDDQILLDAEDAAEEVAENDDADLPMDSDPEETIEEAIQLQNDSIAHFDAHTDSIFCIAQHPGDQAIVATGGGDDITYVWSSSPPSRPLPASYEFAPSERASSEPIAKLTGHTDSINAITFTIPSGSYLVTGGLDGQIRVHTTSDPTYPLLVSAQEVPEVNFLAPCPNPSYPDTFALGASDGSVWVYTINAAEKDNELQVIQAYYLHTEACTAGTWTNDGKLLATVSEDGTFYVWDPFGEAAAKGIQGTGQAIVGLSPEDQRFAVDGGLYSVAIAPGGAFAVVGGAGGNIRVVGLPRFNVPADQGIKGGGARGKNAGAKKSGGPSGEGGQAGQILASLQVQSDGIETLAFSQPPMSLLAAGSVDGSIVLLDHAHRWTVRRHIKEAHDEFAVVKVDFVPPETGKQHLLTSCGMDGVVKRWDTRGGTAAGGQGLVGEWRGHRGEGEKGGVLGFVQGGEKARIVTAGDDSVSLVFDAYD